jgi:general secretion pathway protein G
VSMVERRRRDQTIFFPWERGGGIFAGRGLARAKPFAIAAAFAVVLLTLGLRERRQVGVRATRTSIGVVSRGVDAYMADHEGKCPTTLVGLKAEGYLAIDPVDAWGHPLRLLCPGRRDPQRYDLISDGPDGEMGGLDRVE